VGIELGTQIACTTSKVEVFGIVARTDTPDEKSDEGLQ
jgi:hypothetical protein